jgi:hypothetical protein
MPDPQLDDGVANLSEFVNRIVTNTSYLRPLADDLAAEPQKLDAVQGELRDALTHAKQSADALDVELATYATAVETESESVGAMALGELDAALDGIDGKIRELQQSVPGELATLVDGIEHDLDELRDQGFSPLHEAMNAIARGSIGTWAAAAEESLGRLDQVVDALRDQLQKDEQALGDDDGWGLKQDEQGMWVGVDAATTGVNGGLPNDVAEAPLATELDGLHQSLRQEAHAAMEALRAQLAQLVAHVGEQISPRTLALIDGAAAALEACELAEDGAGQADEEAGAAVPRAAALVALAERIDGADVELRQIQEVLQAMDTP